MKPSLKELRDQVIVIAGASSGVGLATAEAAGREGAKLVLAARSEDALNGIVDDIRGRGGEAVFVPCDVSDAAQVGQVARTAVDRFGRIDTWINNAGLSIYGRLDEVSEADHRRLFDINFWGVVHGSMAALPYLRQHGGALINVGSEGSEAIVPLQGMYSASKHAVKGYTDSLRIEIEELDKAPIAITLIQPTAVDPPFPQHDQEPKPRIDPEEVAKAILDAAVHPTRDRKVGAMADDAPSRRPRGPGGRE
jgi:NAD(P)-dependent dehydrogenase (short-subunit alcohol dehydrogenase family)